MIHEAFDLRSLLASSRTQDAQALTANCHPGLRLFGLSLLNKLQAVWRSPTLPSEGAWWPGESAGSCGCSAGARLQGPGTGTSCWQVFDRLSNPIRPANLLLRPTIYHHSCTGVAQENRAEVTRILELAERAAASWQTLFTNFVTPPVAAEGLQILQRLAGCSATAWGGYAQVCFSVFLV